MSIKYGWAKEINALLYDVLNLYLYLLFLYLYYIYIYIYIYKAWMLSVLVLYTLLHE